MKNLDDLKNSEDLNVLTVAILSQSVFTDNGNYSEFDYAVFFTLNMLHALCDLKTCVLNRVNTAFLDIYYKIVDNIFNLDLKDEDN